MRFFRRLWRVLAFFIKYLISLFYKNRKPPLTDWVSARLNVGKNHPEPLPTIIRQFVTSRRRLRRL